MKPDLSNRVGVVPLAPAGSPLAFEERLAVDQLMHAARALADAGLTFAASALVTMAETALAGRQEQPRRTPRATPVPYYEPSDD